MEFFSAELRTPDADILSIAVSLGHQFGEFLERFQAQERLIGTDQVVDTQIYNGYGEWVASLYAGMPQTRKLFM